MVINDQRHGGSSSTGGAQATTVHCRETCRGKRPISGINRVSTTSSGQGKTGTGFQQNGAIHPSKDEITGKLPNLEKPAQNQERREGDLNSRGARHQRLSRHIAHPELKNTIQMNAHRSMIMR